MSVTVDDFCLTNIRKYGYGHRHDPGRGRPDRLSRCWRCGNRQGFPWRARAGRGRPAGPRRRGALPARAERRRQVDADQGAGRRPLASTRARCCGRASRRRSARRSPRSSRASPPSTRNWTWSTGSRSARTSSSVTNCPRPASRSARPPAGGRESCWQRLGHPEISAEPGSRLAVRRRQADRLGRPGAVPRCPADRDGRAVGRAGRRGGREPLPHRRRPRRRRRGRGLHLAPAGGDPPDRRPDHRAEGRPDGGHRARRPNDADGRADQADDRPVDRVRLPAAVGHAAADRTSQPLLSVTGLSRRDEFDDVSASRSARARSSAWPALSAPAAARSSRRSSARGASDSGSVVGRWRPAAQRLGAGGGAGRGRAVPRRNGSRRA